MQGGRTGTLNRLMGLCQFEAAISRVIPHACSKACVLPKVDEANTSALYHR